jgi:Carboxypeptidase regulatory-like domain/TonB dependent receptor
MNSLWKKAICLASVLFLVCLSGLGQVETGQIGGTVTDQTGAVLAGATISVTNVATNAKRTVDSSSSGGYSVLGLEPATYKVEFNATGFQAFIATVEVTVGGHVTLDAKMSVGASITEVQVVGEGGVQVNTQSHELSQIVNSEQISALPSLTRNPYDFVAISGNVSSGDNTTNSSSSGQNLTSRGVGFSLNGQRQSGTEILLDGAENVGVFDSTVGMQVPVDSVQEYSVVTNNFSPEYGRASGGIVNVTTKSGTNSLHGSVWLFNRLSAYTANTYANDAANQAAGSVVAPKGIYTRNQFGYAIGGPVLKNKLFLFQSTEWTRVRSQASVTNEILDPGFINLLPANAQAYFKQYGTGGLPGSGASTTAGQLAAAGIPVGPINGTNVVPSSTPVFDIINFKTPFDAGGDVPQNQYTLAGRVDFTMTDKTSMFFRAGRQSQDQFAGSAFYSAYPQYNVGYTKVDQSFLYSLTHTFNVNVLNNAKISYTRFNDQNSFNQALTYTPNLMIVPPSDPVTGGLIQLPGLMNYGAPGLGGLPFGGPINTIQPQDDLSWNKGKHSLRFGGVYTYIQLNVAYGAYAQAVQQLGSTLGDSMNSLTNAFGTNPGGSMLTAFQARVNPQGKLPCVANPGFWSSNEASDLQTGPNCAVSPPLPGANYARSYRYHDWAAYAMDSFRVIPRLTLNYGLRYEHFGVQRNNRQSLDSNFYYGSGSTYEQQVRNGGVDITTQSPVGAFWGPSHGTVGPRVGFAYDVMGDGRTSIRGGYGISYERNFGNVTYNASFNPPASAVVQNICPPSSPTTPACNITVTNAPLGPLGVAGPATYLPPAELRMPDPRIHTAQTQFWSLAVQRELMRNMVMEVSYSGARGVHLYDIENINLLGGGQVYLGDPLTFSQSPDCASPCLNRPNEQYSNINVRSSHGDSKYQGLNVKVQTQNLHNSGLGFVLNYTWSHSLDNISSTFSDSLQGGSGVIGSLGYTDFRNPSLDWGSSDFDVRNRVVIAPIWQTPWFKGSGSMLERQLLGGWMFSGIITARNGIPFSVYDYNNVLNGYSVPRLTPVTPINQFKVGSPQAVGPNLFNALSLPIPASFDPYNAALGISDFGPFPNNMTRRNSFRGPGAWNTDLAFSKKFPVTERVGLEFRAEGFDIFNHHNYYVNTTNLYYDGLNTNGSLPSPLDVTVLKGGLGSLATGGNHDERRFGQFALRVDF